MLAIFIIMIYLFIKNSAESSPRIGGVIVNVLASNVVDRGFEPRSGQTKDYITVIACLSARHSALRSKGKEWLTRNQDNMSEWRDLSTRELLFQ